MLIEHEDTLREIVWNTVHQTPVVDMHTHIYAPCFGERLLWGIDEMLRYHYLVAELHRTEAPQGFFDMTEREQADVIWRKLFLEHSPISESTRGVLTSLGMLGLNPAPRDLGAYRAYFEGQSAEEHVDVVLDSANVESVVMTNDPFDDVERVVWEEDPDAVDPRFQAALRLDSLLIEWKNAAKRLKGWGYGVKARLDKTVYPEVTRFLNDWIEIMDPLYLAISLPCDFDPADKSNASKLLAKVVLPLCAERNLPLALMIGVKRAVNPALQLAGDSLGKSDIVAVERLCAENPGVKFLVTFLARENQHELAVTARKFPNLMPFGCWWFLNDPMTIDEITRMRMELLGTSFVPQHSDARVLDQLLYKWAHSRWVIAHVLIEKYCDLHRTGWRVTSEEIERDVADLFANNFKRFVAR